MSTPDPKKLSQLEELLGRVRLISKATTDLATSQALGAVKSSIPQWRTRGTIPYERLVEWGLDQGVNLNWLFTGTGEPFLDDGLREHKGEYDPKIQPKPCRIDYRLMGRVTEVVHEVLGDAVGWRRIGEASGRLYLDVAEFGEDERDGALKMARRWLAWKVSELENGDDER